MRHAIHRVTAVQAIGAYLLKVSFEDGTTQEIDFEPVLAGELLGPLKDLALFGQVSIDPEVHTLVWPNGADFDPAILHDWPRHSEAFRRRVLDWACQPA